MTLGTMQVVDHPIRRGRPPLPKEPCPSCGGDKKPVSQTCRACWHPKNGATAQALIRLAATRPELNLAEAGKIVGVTRERVRQIANKYSLPFYRGQRKEPRPACWVCGEELKGAAIKIHTRRIHQNGKCGWITFTCETCHKPKRMRRSQVIYHLKSPRYLRPYRRCSRKCPGVIREAPCVICGEVITLNPTQGSFITRGIQKRVFCKSCIQSRKRKTA